MTRRRAESVTENVSKRSAASVPTGTVTFLFTDIEGSTSMWEKCPAKMHGALARHDEILRASVEASGGHVFKTVGDAFCAAFATAREALEATLAAQRALFAEPWDEECRLRVRMALHTGVAEERDGDYFGPPVNRVARLLSAGHGGQVLLSAVTYGLVRDALSHLEEGAELRDLGEHRLKDLRYTEHVYQLMVPDLPRDFPPLKTHELVTPAPGTATPYSPPAPKEGITEPPAPVSLQERYTRKGPLGGGGMAEVYLAHDDLLDRDVAMKVLRKQYAGDPQFVERFEREAKNAASLSHPNIVAVHDRGRTEDGSYYIVMECVPGGTLKERIQREGALPPLEAAALARQVARALEAAHRRGVVHRDIKPQNVLLAEGGEAKVADFGIARAASSSTMTKTSSVMGTAHYLSPEQALGEPASPKSDLYSLGVVLYEMLTGELPHDAETPMGIAMKHVHGQIRPPGEIKPGVPGGLNAVVVRLLAKDPDQRYGDAVELAEDLERVGRGEAPAFLATTRPETYVDGASQREPEASTGSGGAGPRTHAPPDSPRAPTRRNKKTALIVAGALGVLLLLLAGGVAMALAVSGLDLLGSTEQSQPAHEEAPAQPSEENKDAATGEKSSEKATSPPSSGSGASEDNAKSEEELRAAVNDYYAAVDRQDWGYTYDNLDSQTKQRYTRDEYVQKNRYLASVDPLAQSSPEITSEVSSSSPVEVTLNQTFASGAAKSRLTYFVLEDGAWKHRFSQQDDAIFLPDASYDEFVARKKSGS